MKNLIAYVCGKGGSPSEIDHFKPLFPNYDAIGLEYRGDLPWEAAEDIRVALEKAKSDYDKIVLIANSIGAFFCMIAQIDDLIDNAYFISPIVDMERIIVDMMNQAKVTEEALKSQGEIRTPSGEVLSWDYLRYVRERPLQWRVPTRVLYGSADALTPREAISKFVEETDASLTIMENGEHWFHTDELMRFLDDWIRKGVADDLEKVVLETERLKIYPASRAKMEEIIDWIKAPELKKAFREMLEGCLRRPDQWNWRAMWLIELKDGTSIGDLGFKGLGDDGVAEIGYGLMTRYRGQGYMTEAVKAACAWAFQNPNVTALEAETLPDNTASQRVLEKCGFRPTGRDGKEGPRFTLKRQRSDVGSRFALPRARE